MDRRWLTYCHLSAVSGLLYGPNLAAAQLTFTQLWQEGRRPRPLGNKSSSAESKTVLIVLGLASASPAGRFCFLKAKRGER